MFKGVDIGLRAAILSFMKKFNIRPEKEKESDIFEHFVNYVVISKETEVDYNDFSKISTNPSFPGIDGVGIIINGKVISELQDLEILGNNEKIKVKIVLIQSTLISSFKEEKFAKFVDEAIDFLIGSLKIEPFSEILDRVFNNYVDNIIETPKVLLYFVSGKTSHNIGKFIDKQKNKFLNRDDIRPKYELDNIYFWQAHELKTAFESIPRFYKVEIEVDKSVQLTPKDKVQVSLLCAIDFKELKKLILNTDGFIKEELFVENPRYYLKNTDVNKDIKNTLNDENLRKYFVYLNNGLTILCDDISRHPVKDKVYILTYPRIINGLQTTYILYEEYKRNPNILNDVQIVAKIIATRDKILKEKIIFSTNNQNSIDKDLVAINDFHKKIEEYFSIQDPIIIDNENSVQLYYERLRGQYPEVNPPYAKIDIFNIAKVYISVFHKEPHKMKKKAIKIIEDYIREKKIFHMEDLPAKYYYCGLLHFWINYFTINKNINMRTRTMDMHLLLGIDLFLDKIINNNVIEYKIEYLKTVTEAFPIFQQVTEYLHAQDYLFRRKGFYSKSKTKQLIENIKKLDNSI